MNIMFFTDVFLDISDIIQATGNRQQATGNRQQATGNRLIYLLFTVSFLLRCVLRVACYLSQTEQADAFLIRETVFRSRANFSPRCFPALQAR
jgi:hypothetical protein